MSLSATQFQTLRGILASAVANARGRSYLFTSITMNKIDTEKGNFVIEGSYQSGLGAIVERGTYEATLDSSFKIVRLILHQKT